jgi:WD40 repeat protein
MPNVLLLVLLVVLTGCTSFASQPTETAPLPTKTIPAPTQTITPTSTSSPSPTFTSSPTPSPTPTRTLTPTTTATPQPVAISASNASHIILETTYDLPMRGLLEWVSWSKDGEMVLVSTSLGIYLLDSTLSQQIYFYPALKPIQEFEDGSWLVQTAEGVQTLSLQGQDHQLGPNRHPIFSEPGLLISANGEVAVRKISQEEFEVIKTATGEYQTFNLPKAGYYFNYLDLGSISPDGKRLSVRGATNLSSSYLFFNSETLQVIAVFPNLYGPPYFSPDSQSMLIRDRGGYKVLKTSNGIQNNRFSDGFSSRTSSGVRLYYQAGSRAFLPDSQSVGMVYCPQTGSCDLYQWSQATGYPESILYGLPEGTRGINYSRDGSKVLSVSGAEVVQSWDLETQTLLNESEPFDRTGPVVSQDGRLVAVLRGSQVEIIDIQSREVLKMIGDYSTSNELSIDSVADDHLLVSMNLNYKENRVDLWDVSAGTLVRQFKPISYFSSNIDKGFCTYAWQGERILCGTRPFQVFDTQNGRLLMSYKNTQDPGLMAISPDGNHLASCKSDRVFLVDPADTTSAIAMVLEAKERWICSEMIFSPDNQYLAAQSGYIWKIDQALPIASFNPIVGGKMAFSPDSSLLVVENQVIQTSTGMILKELEVYSEAWL